MRRVILFIFLLKSVVFYAQTFDFNKLKMNEFNSIEAHQGTFQGNYIKLTTTGLICRKYISETLDSIIFIKTSEIDSKKVYRLVQYVNDEKLNVNFPEEILEDETPTGYGGTSFVFQSSYHIYKCILDFHSTKEFNKLIKLLNNIIPKKHRSFFQLKILEPPVQASEK